MSRRILIFIPTYQERDNAERMCRELFALGLDADVLFLDDNSPDGTGQALEALKPEFPRLVVHHRNGKLGIGTAHRESIQWAYDQDYDILVTMDCDYTHQPEDVSRLLAASEQSDIVVGSRFMEPGSLPGWIWYRRMLTIIGHTLTHSALGLPHDASGAFRVYRLRQIPRSLFDLVQACNYAFFYESLFVLSKNGLRIKDVAIILPARTYGHSKMSWREAMRSGFGVFKLALRFYAHPERFRLNHARLNLNPGLVDPQNWNAYWSADKKNDALAYEVIASIYRRNVIRPHLECAIHRHFAKKARLLHCGCGSGQVDMRLHDEYHVNALDISDGALRLYANNNPHAESYNHGSIYDIPAPEGSFDGVYSLGVMEHFTRNEIEHIIRQMTRVTRPGGILLFLWPHQRASSVAVLKMVHSLRRKVAGANSAFHPPEISLMPGRSWAQDLLSGLGLEMVEYSFGLNDLFVQAVIAARKPVL
ncbi:MAG: glycosyltransferase [Prosthecobacter sp.]|uniref:glycosyltransferase n=1 Tax=Prosthecobacter sp. TaxID=1965333 RepID=UPI0038FD7712